MHSKTQEHTSLYLVLEGLIKDGYPGLVELTQSLGHVSIEPEVGPLLTAALYHHVGYLRLCVRVRVYVCVCVCVCARVRMCVLSSGS